MKVNSCNSKEIESLPISYVGKFKSKCYFSVINQIHNVLGALEKHAFILFSMSITFYRQLFIIFKKTL